MRIQLLSALVLACALPVAHAQEEAPAAEAAAQNPIVLRVESGNVMVSQQGAEFVTVDGDVTVAPQDRILVPEQSVASLDYGEGCLIPLMTGAYPVAETCPDRDRAAAVLPGGSSNTGLIVGGVAAAVALGALASGGSSSPPPPPPVSP